MLPMNFHWKGLLFLSIVRWVGGIAVREWRGREEWVVPVPVPVVWYGMSVCRQNLWGRQTNNKATTSKTTKKNNKSVPIEWKSFLPTFPHPIYHFKGESVLFIRSPFYIDIPFRCGQTDWLIDFLGKYWFEKKEYTILHPRYLVFKHRQNTHK